MNDHWYEPDNIHSIDSPAVMIFKERVRQNIQTLVDSIDDIKRLRPHIKTNKSPEVTAMLLQSGICKFKCATIAEAEMLALAGAADILLAYQPVGPKVTRLLALTDQFPEASFSCLVDNTQTAKELADVFFSSEKVCGVYIDLNVGMNRTGIVPDKAFEMWNECRSFPGLKLLGLHAYDGHIRDIDFEKRKARCNKSFDEITSVAAKIGRETSQTPIIVAGGTPTFSIHSKRKDVECSPGTFVYWDKGYEQILLEQNYLHAAVIVTRVISKPSEGIICVDLGHKAVASENPLTQRIHFLNGLDLQPIGHSEEHMVLKTDDDSRYKVGDVLYGIPFHVCPTIALYDRTAVVENGSVTEYWLTPSRNRAITI